MWFNFLVFKGLGTKVRQHLEFQMTRAGELVKWSASSTAIFQILVGSSNLSSIPVCRQMHTYIGAHTRGIVVILSCILMAFNLLG